MDSPIDPHVGRFVRTLLITGAWLDEVVSGLSAELPNGSYPGEGPRAVVLEMLCEAIGTAMHSVEPDDLRLATELVDLAGWHVEEHLRLACELSGRLGRRSDGDVRTDG